MRIFYEVIKHIINTLITFIMSLGLLMVIFLVVNKAVGLVFTIIMTLIYLGVFCFCIYSFVYSSKAFKFLFFKGIIGLLSFTIVTIACTFVTIFYFSINHMISTELGESLTIKEKLEIYLLPFKQDQNTPTDYHAMKANKLSKKYRNVEIYYEPHEKDLLPIIEQVLDKTDIITTNFLGNVQDNDIDLILHSSSEELYDQTSLIKTMGYFDDPNNTVGVAISDLEEILSDRMPGIFYFQSTIMHEYTHYRLQTFMKEQGLYVNRIPLWFHEGVAEYVGMYDVGHRYSPFKEAPFEKLVTHEEWEKHRLDNYDVYIQSYYAIQFLVEKYGETVIKSIIEETAKKNDFNEGFTRATGITIKDLQIVYVKDKQIGMEQY